MDTQKLKQNIKITELARSLGLELRGNKTCCIFHNEKTPSLSFDDGKGIYKCFGCGEAGDAITLYQKIKGVDFKEACIALGAEPDRQPNTEVYSDFIAYLKSQGRGEAVEKYLKARGFEKSVLDKFNICGIKDLEATKKYLLEKFSKDELSKAGLTTKQGFIFNSHPVIIPIYKNGRVVSLQGRSIVEQKLKYLNPSGIPLPIFNSDEEAEEIYLTEGAMDAMMLSQLGAVAWGLFGTNGFKDEFKNLFKDKDVVLAFDGDEAGKKATKDISEKIKDVAGSIQSIKIPEGKDVCSCFTEGMIATDLPKETIKEEIKIVHLSEIADAQGEVELIKTGMYFLDEAMGGGIAKGGAMIVAAMAGEGKTTFMQSVSYNFAKQKIKCLWFSYEEAVNAIWNRFKGMGLGKEHLLYAPIDLADNKIDYIEKAIKKYKKQNEFFVVFIDQLSHIAPKVDKNTNIDHLSNNFSLYLGIMSTQLKDLAMKYGIVVVVAHQLGRSGELAYSDMVRHAPDKVVYLEREKAPSGGQDKFTDKTFMKMNKNRPIGTAPIVPMKVFQNRFIHYESSEQMEDAIKIMGGKLIY